MVTGPHRRAPGDHTHRPAIHRRPAVSAAPPRWAPGTRYGHDGGVAETEVRALRAKEHRAAAGVAARALADSPTAVAIYGPDPLDCLAGLHAELAPFFALLPEPQMAVVVGDCVLAVAGIAPPGGCIGS